MKDFLKTICIEAGELTLKYKHKDSALKIDAKSEKDFVTEADLAVEKLLVERILAKYPAHSILGEETGAHAGSEYRWIIDPIDGTNCFMHGHPFYSISIAIEKGDTLELAAVYAPVLGELFMAQRGKGATLNDVPIAVSETTETNNAMVATGFACLRENKAKQGLKLFCDVVPHVRDVRRHGSAAMDVCYVACGRFDFYWESYLNIYDVAAGRLILEEAGGRLTDFSGGQTKLYSEVAASNGVIHSELLRLLNKR
ncbi:MAG: inositol monophosphatase [Phycisphaerae bacterium]|jgi:myo-inositol-1(or 4)-monophosphatase